MARVVLLLLAVLALGLPSSALWVTLPGSNPLSGADVTSICANSYFPENNFARSTFRLALAGEVSYANPHVRIER